MPREDVPYPTSAICSIRERIAELRDELDQLLKTVNGVAGDANHDIKLISDNAALGITNDAVQHEIHLDLDASQLPAALVDSVNGQIGTVVLDGDDLDGVTPGNSVNDDITALQGADVTLQGNINAEATARANGDSSLATAINAALATIPGEVSSQIASNAAIIQLQNDVLAIPNKVDKRTGAGKFAYTHDGSTQGDIALVDGTTAATIPIRDANGRMQAADPASGATDKTLVTSNWVSQTGDSSPNNLVHRSGAETKTGKFTMDDGMVGYQNDWHQTDKSGMNINDYCIFAKIPGGYSGRYQIIDFCQSSNTACAYGRLMLRRNAGAVMPVWLYRKTNGANNPLQSDSIHVLHDGTDIYLAWKKLAPYGSLFAALTFEISYGTVQKVSNQNMTWYTTAQMIVTNDISAYTDVTVVE